MGKPYSEICDNLAVKMIYEPYAVYRVDRLVFKNGKMDVPPTPVPEYLSLNQISLDSEMVQTFVEHCGISQVDIAREGVNKQMGRREERGGSYIYMIYVYGRWKVVFQQAATSLTDRASS